MNIEDLPTPALLIDASAFEHNITTMAMALPGGRLRPHVKAFKCTAIARRLAELGHTAFCCATVREMVGMAEAGLGDDLLLANQSLNLAPLGALAAAGRARVTVAIDSPETLQAAIDAGIGEVLIDVNVGMPRCGCAPEDAAQLADAARTAGIIVRGVMGYEGHAVGIADRETREREVAKSMVKLAEAATAVGGDVISSGGTGSYDSNTLATEIQAGSYTLMDSAYAELHLPFVEALSVLGTVISVSGDGYTVADVGLKSLGMDHGDPWIDGATVWFCSDEHITFSPDPDAETPLVLPKVGDKVKVRPAHVDPTMAKHERAHLVKDDELLEIWDIDLRHW